MKELQLLTYNISIANAVEIHISNYVIAKMLQ